MIWVCFVFLLMRLLFPTWWIFSPEYFANNFLHRACLEWSAWQAMPVLYNGLFCGSSQIDAPTKNLFLQTGLYHLLVVSGAHLVFLENSLDRFLKGHEKLKLLIFFLFSLMCELNPPILRAFFSQSLRVFSLRRHLFQADEARILCSGLICLIVFPQWIHSTSLILSWTASLALNYKSAAWKKHFIVALYLLPWTQMLSGATVVNNLIFSFAFEYLLFPVSFVLFLLPGSSPLAEALWNATTTLMAYLPTAPQSLAPPPAALYWPYVFLFHLVHRVKT